MSKIALSGDASGTGTFTIASPNSNSNYTLTIPQATTTIVGTDATQTLTNKTINGSQLVAASVTSTQMATAVQPIGVGQTWSDVTGSRVSNTTYTNSTGRPIMVAVSTNMATNARIEATVGGVKIMDMGGSTIYGDMGLNVFIVPDSTTYKVQATQGTIQIWAELR